MGWQKWARPCKAECTEVVCLCMINKLNLVYVLRDPPIFSKTAFLKKIFFENKDWSVCSVLEVACQERILTIRGSKNLAINIITLCNQTYKSESKPHSVVI